MCIIKSAVIGLGNIGLLYDFDAKRVHPSTHVMGYTMDPEYSLAIVVDPDLNKWDLLKNDNKNCCFCKDIDEVINEGLDDDIEVVSICSPPETHLELIKKALGFRSCKVIFCEKPIVNSMSQVTELRKLMRDNNDTIIIPNISRRWSTGLKEAISFAKANGLDRVEKINGRYTRGIINMGSHLFDLIYMVTGARITSVLTLGETDTSSLPEKTYSFYFFDDSGTTGYIEAINDRNYYLFDLDFYYERGKIEFRYSGDEIRLYLRGKHHLFSDINGLFLKKRITGILSESQMKNALNDIKLIVGGKKQNEISVENAIYPLYVADAIERSYRSRDYEFVNYEIPISGDEKDE